MRAIFIVMCLVSFCSAAGDIDQRPAPARAWDAKSTDERFVGVCAAASVPNDIVKLGWTSYQITRLPASEKVEGVTYRLTQEEAINRLDTRLRRQQAKTHRLLEYRIIPYGSEGRVVILRKDDKATVLFSTKAVTIDPSEVP